MASCEYPGDRLRLVKGWRGVSCGETDFLRKAAGNADQQEADGKQPEIRTEERHGGNAAADGAHQRADHEACLAAKEAGCSRHADRAERNADIETGERRGRQRLIRAEQLIAGKSADRKAQGRSRSHDRLRDGEEKDVALRLVQLNFKSGDGNGAHVFLT
jgi:hypothetical protein